MLDSYLEPNLQHKLKLLSILHVNEGGIASKDLQQAAHLSAFCLSSLLTELALDLDGLGRIVRQASRVWLEDYQRDSFLRLFHAVYRSSTVLRCLRFFLCNDQHRPFSDFMNQEFLTKSSSYRIRQRCLDYLHEIGLELNANCVAGPEHRIRYLIALLHHRYGIDCYPPDPKAQQLARRFILSTNRAIDLELLEQTETEYGFCEYLLILGWKRQRYPLPPLDAPQFVALKQLFAHKALRQAIQQTLEPALGLRFSQQDYDYFYLVFVTCSSCLFADQWSPQDIQQLYCTIFSDPAFADLIDQFGQRYGEKVKNSKAVQSILVFFYRKCIMGLQCIIPDKNFCLSTPRTATDLAMLQQLTELFDQWQKAHGIQYRIDSSHLLTMSMFLEFTLRQFTPPVPVIVLSDVDASLEVLKRFLARSFSEDRISVTLMLISVQSMDLVCDQQDKVIIVPRHFQRLARTCGLYRHNIVIPITAAMDDRSIHAIHNAVATYERRNFLKLIHADPQLLETELPEQAL